MQSITPEVLFALAQEQAIQLVDVRSSAEFARGHARGATNVPLEQLTPARLRDFDTKAPIYVICKSGMRSLLGVRRLHQEGIVTAVNVAGGTDAWMWAGLPIDTERSGSATW
ncbi:MAG: rhodanese-like domain-containing protein [Betaproteobacteria bacterium]|nr:rhodanese-like domain-containing protein [Betaproteobacteria bacterium]